MCIRDRPWIVRHAGNTINRYHRGTDGMTAYRRLKGKEFKAEVVEFGEGVWYMKADTTGRNKADARWEEGIWWEYRKRAENTS